MSVVIRVVTLELYLTNKVTSDAKYLHQNLLKGVNTFALHSDFSPYEYYGLFYIE